MVTRLLASLVLFTLCLSTTAHAATFEITRELAAPEHHFMTFPFPGFPAYSQDVLAFSAAPSFAFAISAYDIVRLRLVAPPGMKFVLSRAAEFGWPADMVFYIPGNSGTLTVAPASISFTTLTGTAPQPTVTGFKTSNDHLMIRADGASTPSSSNFEFTEIILGWDVSAFSGSLHTYQIEDSGGFFTGPEVTFYQSLPSGSPDPGPFMALVPINPSGWEDCGTTLGGVNINYPAQPSSAPDGSGGAIVGWIDLTSGAPDVRAQRIAASGHVQWGSNGIPVCSATGVQSDVLTIADGGGGAIFAWTDPRAGTGPKIYAQRVNSVGLPMWAPDGVVVGTAPGDQTAVALVSDGAFGAILAWADTRSGNSDVYAQRLAPTGTRLWDTAGVAIRTAPGNQAGPVLAATTGGGAIIGWSDAATGDVYAQRIDGNGVFAWPAAGVQVATVPGTREVGAIVSDFAGGAILCWTQALDLHAQRLNASGSRLWGSSGLPISAATGSQETPRMITDSASGAIVVWSDTRNGPADLFAQRVLAPGSVSWAPNGVPVIAALADQIDQVVAPDGTGGVLVAWVDLRGQFGQYDVRGQRLDPNGNRLWDADGARVCSSVPGQSSPTIVGNGTGGAIVSFQNGDVAIVAATRFSTSGRTVTDADEPALIPALLSACPNPFRERVNVRFAVARSADIRLEVFDVRGRRVHLSQRRFAPGTHSWAWDGRAAGAELPAGVYFTRIVWPDREETRRITKLR